ncbi:CDP-glycerol glycerophosphotransferase family protein [Cytobacillus sp. IB215665]|uniref:CDP-glycerol glycerophosphotransferase family protein n=1 Tax=Cytobacillus sp. IB215665 TaxID=3097357 RepID=UPI002A1687D2|nr:CDP-glycerol glycerophosphotransferase family protein [Cytobacillus sp. IB215665]MDX8366161.1 CDP-glycerol glycerophosphotransferase family protein [Cytobacillus sp. IB215665]
MVKELIISSYLLIFKLVFNLCKQFKLKKKLTFVISYEENAHFLYKELIKQSMSIDIIILCKTSTKSDLQHIFQEAKIYTFESKNILHWLLSIYHLATSKIIIIDNYFAFLSAITFKKNVECIQIWHAAGALKTFGLQDKSVRKRSNKAQRRFRKVYKQFHKVVVGSEEMAHIFMESFHISANHILPTGIPRTDLFYDEQLTSQIKGKLYSRFPLLKHKQKILYAPTFRHGQLNNYNIKLDLDKLYEKLRGDYILILKLHPMVKVNVDYERTYKGFIVDLSSYKSTNELLMITDYLITDYSSIPFEYAILQKPMIFYPYDLKIYQQEQGVIQDYETTVPGPIANDTEEIIEFILTHPFNDELILQFYNRWNEHSKGNSSNRLVQYILTKIT